MQCKARCWTPEPVELDVILSGLDVFGLGHVYTSKFKSESNKSMAICLTPYYKMGTEVFVWDALIQWILS